MNDVDMPARRRLYLGIFLLVLAPIGAAVLITSLLLFGVRPQVVFAPGWAVMWCLEVVGLHVPNPVGVVSTGLFWWAIFAILGLAWERFRRPGAARPDAF